MMSKSEPQYGDVYRDPLDGGTYWMLVQATSQEPVWWMICLEEGSTHPDSPGPMIGNLESHEFVE
jgi:hypothetical protein